MKFPANVRIGYRDYAVIPVENGDSIVHDLDEDQAGQSDHYKQNIHYLTDAPPQGQANTILHEILHAILAHFDILQQDDKLEERVVVCLTNGLCQVIQDNPAMLQTITEGLSGYPDNDVLKDLARRAMNLSTPTPHNLTTTYEE